MAISIPGAVFSSLVFHLKNAPSDAEGFLCGSMRSHHVESITDSQSSGTREEKRLYVESFVCFSERFKFYDHYGRPHSERICALLGEDEKRVVGWFSYRRNTSHRPSTREKVVHRRLTDCFPGISSRDFLFGLVTEQVVDGSSVHSTDYSFYNWIGTSLKLVKVGIINLQVTATVPYQQFPVTPIPPSLPHYSSTLQQHRSKFVDAEGRMTQALVSEQLYKAVLERLKPLCTRLSVATARVECERQEIDELEQQLQRLTTHTEAEKKEGDSCEAGLNSNSSANTTAPSTAGARSAQGATRELIQVAPLDGEPTTAAERSPRQHTSVFIDLTSTADDAASSDRLLTNGDVPLIHLPNVVVASNSGGSGRNLRQKNEWCASGEVVEMAAGGGEAATTTNSDATEADSVLGSQELF